MAENKKSMQPIGIVFLDTGIFPHLDFDNRIVAFCDFVQRKSSAYDDNGHGTHVAGIASGSGFCSKGLYHGVNPHANIISIKVLDQLGNGKIAHVLRSFEWIIKNKERYNMRIVNISIGAVENTSDNVKELLDGVEHLWDLGFVVVTAAGNLGPMPGSITVPGTSKKVITVGCSDMLNAKTDSSGRGPTMECICKPDIVANGKNIMSCANFYNKNPYVRKSGTSMATPYISGAISKLLEKDPYLTNLEIKMLLKSCAEDIGYARNQQGWGKLNLEKFLKS